MLKHLPALLLPVLASCRSLEQPHYMLDALDSPEAARLAMDEITADLGPGFRTLRLRDLFFVASNASPDLTATCLETIASVDDSLRRTYFTRRPTRPLRVLLFKDEDCYRAYVRRVYGRESTTHFGFYVAGERKMVVNIGTGTGTLAHELVHPLLGEDFPGIPTWFNEGFASLFERFRVGDDDRPIALVNWRLPGLQRSLRENRGGVLRALLDTDATAFYQDDEGLHYAASRFLCLWLQERNLLKTFYDRFKTAVDEDPTGRATLIDVVRSPLDRIEQRWREWVLGLEFR